MNRMHMFKFSYGHLFSFYWVYIQELNFGLYAMCMFKCKSNRKTVYKAFIPFYIPTRDITVAPNPCQHLVLLVLILAILVGVEWHLILILVLLSLMNNDS